MYTKRHILTEEFKGLVAAYQSATKAYSDLIDGKIVSYTLGNRSVTRSQADLRTLMDFMDRTRRRMNELEAILSGKAVRGTSRCVFVDPASTFWGRK